MTDTENTALEKLCPSLSEQRIIYSVVEIKLVYSGIIGDLEIHFKP